MPFIVTELCSFGILVQMMPALTLALQKTLSVLLRQHLLLKVSTHCQLLECLLRTSRDIFVIYNKVTILISICVSTVLVVCIALKLGPLREPIKMLLFLVDQFSLQRSTNLNLSVASKNFVHAFKKHTPDSWVDVFSYQSRENF